MANTSEQQSGARTPGVLGQAKDVVPRSAEFLKESWQELRRVHWPTPKETYAATAIVLVVVVAVAFFLGLVDFGLSFAMRQILNQGQ